MATPTWMPVAISPVTPNRMSRVSQGGPRQFLSCTDDAHQRDAGRKVEARQHVSFAGENRAEGRVDERCGYFRADDRLREATRSLRHATVASGSNSVLK